ncbi:homeobox-like protein HDP1 [Cydia splendana]|uniref:homeobox-like protein HDP1 n=1 Tax=Cydia splendana TaxID=1100963 RepID=UPI00300C9A14
MFKYLFIFISSVVVENRAFLTTDTAVGLMAKNPVLMRLLQTVDAATTDDRLMDVSLQLLKSLCVCMRETLKAKQHESASFSGDTNSLQVEKNNKDPSNKVLDIYQNIYKKTCFDLKNEVASKVNKSTNISSDEETEFMLKSDCGRTHIQANTNILKQEVRTDINKTRLEYILYQTFIKTRGYHRFRTRKYSLYKHTKKLTRVPGKHNVIVILTFYPVKDRCPLISNYTKLIDELNSTLHTHSPIDIDIIDARFGQNETVSGESLTANEAPDCALKSIYTFLLQSERNNKTQVFKLMHRNNTIKVYIDVTSEPYHSDYTKMCCSNKTDEPVCKINFPNESFDSKEITTSTTEKSRNLKETILKIKSLVKLYDKRLKKKKFKRSTTLQTVIKRNNLKSDLITEGEYSISNPLRNMPESKYLLNYTNSKEIWMNRILDDESSHEKDDKGITVKKQITSPDQEVTASPNSFTKKHETTVPSRVVNNEITSVYTKFKNDLIYPSESNEPITSTEFFNIQKKEQFVGEAIISQTTNLLVTQTPDIIHPQIDRTTRQRLTYWDQTNYHPLSRSPTTEKPSALDSETVISPFPTDNRDVSTVSNLPIEDTLEIVVTANNKQKKISLHDLFAEQGLNVITQNLPPAGEVTSNNTDKLAKTFVEPNSMPTLFSICIALTKKLHSTEHTDHQFTPTKITNIATTTMSKDSFFTVKDSNNFSDTGTSDILSKENNTTSSLPTNLLETGPQRNKAIDLVSNETIKEDLEALNRNPPFKVTEVLVKLKPQSYLPTTNLHTTVSNDTNKVSNLTQSYGTTTFNKHNDTFDSYRVTNYYSAGLETFNNLKANVVNNPSEIENLLLHNNDMSTLSVNSTTTAMSDISTKYSNQTKIDRNITVTNQLTLPEYTEKINLLDHYTETTSHPEINNMLGITQKIFTPNSKTNNLIKDSNQNKTGPNYTINKQSNKTLPDYVLDRDKLEKDNKTNNFVNIVPKDDFNLQMIKNISYKAANDVNPINKNSLFVTVFSDNQYIQTQQTKTTTVTQPPTMLELVENLSIFNINPNQNLDTITYPVQNITQPQRFKMIPEIKDNSSKIGVSTDHYTRDSTKVEKEQPGANESTLEKSPERLTTNTNYLYVTDKYIENTIYFDYNMENTNILNTNKYNTSLELDNTKNKYVTSFKITPTENYTLKPALFNERNEKNNFNYSNNTSTMVTSRALGANDYKTFLNDFTDQIHHIGSKAETYIDSTATGLLNEEMKNMNSDSTVSPIV